MKRICISDFFQVQIRKKKRKVKQLKLHVLNPMMSLILVKFDGGSLTLVAGDQPSKLSHDHPDV